MDEALEFAGMVAYEPLVFRDTQLLPLTAATQVPGPEKGPASPNAETFLFPK